MSLFDSASLVVTPNGYKEDKLYSIKPTDGSGDLVVTRATTATRVNSAGLIELVPYNLLQRSQEFNNATWLNVNDGTGSAPIISANYTTAPDGTNTAERIQFSKGVGTTSSDYSLIIQTSLTLNSTGTASIYLKSLTGNNQNIVMYWGAGQGQVFEVTSQWQRFTLNNLSEGTSGIAFGTRGGSSYFSGGDNSLDIAIWGAQLVSGSSAKEYFPTTDRLDVPRLDYTNSTCPSILVEPQRTNLALNSDGNVSTYPTAINVTNASSSFNSFSNAIQFPSTGLALAYKSVVTTAQTYAISVFIKMDDNSVPILSASATTGNMCLVIAGAIVTNNLKVESYGNNVYRLSGTATSAAVNINNGVIRYDTQVLKSFKITGIQLEAASYPTSYIPTIASTVTRNADLISKTGISSLIGQTEGTLFADVNWTVKPEAGSPIIGILTINNNVANLNNCIILGVERQSGGNNRVYCLVQNSGSTVAGLFGSNITNGRYKIALAYKANDFVLYVNGVQIATDTSGAVPTCSQVLLGTRYNNDPFVLADSINSSILFKTRLSNTELAQLTTL